MLRKRNWNVCGNFKIPTWTTGWLYKVFLFTCLWDSTVEVEHYHRRDWPFKSELPPGTHNVLVFTQYSKRENTTSLTAHTAWAYEPIYESTRPKVRGGILIGPQIRQILASEEFEKNFKC